MLIFLKKDYNDLKLFERIATRLALYKVFSPSSKDVLQDIDEGYQVNEERLNNYTHFIDNLRDLIDISAQLEIELLIINEENDNDMSKDLFFQMRESAHYDDIHEFVSNSYVPAWIAEGFESRQAWEQDNQHDADSHDDDIDASLFIL